MIPESLLLAYLYMYMYVVHCTYMYSVMYYSNVVKLHYLHNIMLTIECMHACNIHVHTCILFDNTL